MNKLTRVHPEINNFKEYLYRYEERVTVSIYGGDRRVNLELNKYEILRKTKCGVWISGPGYRDRFVDTRSTTRKKFACITEEEALASYMARRSCQIRILEARLRTAKVGMQLAMDKDSKREQEAPWVQTSIL